MGILGKLKLKKEDKQTEKKEVVNVEKKTLVKKEKKEENKTLVLDEKVNTNSSYKVLIHPLVTEKSAVLESENKYSFIVDKRANKKQIKIAVKDSYGVMPVDVKTVNVEGKRKRFGKNFGKRKDFKKAMVSLPKGKTINVHEGV